MRNKIAAVLGLLVITAGLVGCSVRPPADEIYLVYNAGNENKNFKECVEPGTKGPGVVDDDVYALPVSLRTWAVIKDGSGDSKDPFVVGSAPDSKGQAGPQMAIWATVDFYLNTYCGDTSDDKAGNADSPVVKFWEKTGRRAWVDGHGVATSGEDGFQEDAWKKMLQNTLVSVEDALLQAEARKYRPDDLDTNANDVWATMEKNMSEAFNAAVKEKVGGDYFCGVTYDRTKPDCPALKIDITGVDYRDEGIQTARNNVRKAEEEAKAELIRAQAELEKANILAQANRNPNYLEFARLEAEVETARLQLEAAKACSSNPNCTVIVGAPAGVNVGAK